jgi:predicted transposase YbfD/YdcC
MDAKAADLLARVFCDVDDPRADNSQHLLTDILTIALTAVISGGNDYPGIVEYARDKEPLLRKVLRLRAGIPSASTFRRVLAAVEPAQLQKVMQRWMGLLAGALAGKQIALDGKVLRRAFEHAWKKMGVNMVTAWCVEDALVLAQQAVEDKSNEIPVAPQLLALLDIEGAVITADSLHCQRKTVQAVLDGGGDYVLGVKGNQQALCDQVQRLLNEAVLEDFAGVDHARDTIYERAHGRETTWRVFVSEELTQYVRERTKWAGLRTLVVVESTRVTLSKRSVERRYYISSLPQSNWQRIAAAVRNHWSIENGQHWCLDMAFREDLSRVRTDHGAENLGILRRLALSLLKQDKTVKAGLETKRLKAGRNDQYLFHVLTQESAGM